jgi:hypothetical protein
MCLNDHKRKFSKDTHHHRHRDIAQELLFSSVLNLDVGLFGDDPDDPGGGAGHHGRVLQGLRPLLPPPLLPLQPALHTAAKTK